MRFMAQVLILASFITAILLGRDFLVPIAVAALVATVIAASSDRLQHIGLPAADATAMSVFGLRGRVGPGRCRF